MNGRVRIVRDVVLSCVGIFILLHETLVAMAPEPVLVGTALVLLGIPPSLRLDEWRRR